MFFIEIKAVKAQLHAKICSNIFQFFIIINTQIDLNSFVEL